MVQRWRQLPLDHALSCVPTVRRVLAGLAGADVPDLGPAVAMDQLTVLVYDACAAARDEEQVRHRLVELRAQLSRS